MFAPYSSQQPVIQQPIASQGLTVNPRNSLNKPDVEGNGREWSYGLCDYNDCNIFCLAWFLPCIIYGSNKQRLEYLERNGTPDPKHGSVCNGNCITFCVGSFCGVSPLLLWWNRQNMRRHYNIEGDSCTDCYASCFCTPCVLTQEEAEINLEERALIQQGGYQKS